MPLPTTGRVAESADAQASGACVRKDVGVQVPPRPPAGRLDVDTGGQKVSHVLAAGAARRYSSDRSISPVPRWGINATAPSAPWVGGALEARRGAWGWKA